MAIILFDGFPRTVAQANAMRSSGVRIDYVLQIDVDDVAVIERLSGGRVHLASGRSYHLVCNPPARTGLDDITGDALEQCSDDAARIVKRRLSTYHEQTEQLVDYYANRFGAGEQGAPLCLRVCGVSTVEQIQERVIAALRPTARGLVPGRLVPGRRAIQGATHNRQDCG